MGAPGYAEGGSDHDHGDSKSPQPGGTPGPSANFQVTSVVDNANTKFEAKRYYRKKTELFSLLEKIKLWPSRSGVLHGIRAIEFQGESALITTHCGKTFTARNSRNSRAARWLRNKYWRGSCPVCAVPDWKLKKYGQTVFSRHQGKILTRKET